MQFIYAEPRQLTTKTALELPPAEPPKLEAVQFAAATDKLEVVHLLGLRALNQLSDNNFKDKIRRTPTQEQIRNGEIDGDRFEMLTRLEKTQFLLGLQLRIAGKAEELGVRLSNIPTAPNDDAVVTELTSIARVKEIPVQPPLFLPSGM